MTVWYGLGCDNNKYEGKLGAVGTKLTEEGLVKQMRIGMHRKVCIPKDDTKGNERQLQKAGRAVEMCGLQKKHSLDVGKQKIRVPSLNDTAATTATRRATKAIRFIISLDSKTEG